MARWVPPHERRRAAAMAKLAEAVAADDAALLSSALAAAAQAGVEEAAILAAQARLSEMEAEAGADEPLARTCSVHAAVRAEEPLAYTYSVQSEPAPEPAPFSREVLQRSYSAPTERASVPAREGGRVRILVDDDVIGIARLGRPEVCGAGGPDGDDPDYAAIGEERHRRLRGFARRATARAGLAGWREAADLSRSR